MDPHRLRPPVSADSSPFACSLRSGHDNAFWIGRLVRSGQMLHQGFSGLSVDVLVLLHAAFARVGGLDISFGGYRPHPCYELIIKNVNFYSRASGD